jgi:NADPH-dependent 7-cyano-7-deazaguanine reductase QueF-like protein
LSSLQRLGDVFHDNQGIAAISQVHLPSNSPELNCSRLFLWGYLEAQVFTHTLPDINSLKNAIRQDIANVTQNTLRRVMASVPGKWQQCLDCHGGHLQDVVLKM